jgi:hypothetical protein
VLEAPSGRLFASTLSDFITSRMPTRLKRHHGQNQSRLRAHSYDMKYLLRNLLIAAAPFLLRELLKRLDAGRQPSRHPRHLVARRH